MTMNNRLLLSLLLIFVFNNLLAQDLGPCGTPSHKSAWLKKYQLAPQDFSKMEDTIIYVPLTIHLVGTDEGIGFFSPAKLMDAFCTLNEDFEATNIQFYLEGDINYIYSSAYLNHASVLDGAEMMFEHNIEHTLNCYFVTDPAGNCGYNLPYAGLAVAKSCADINDHTWAHEVGHALSLPHPFLGWEGGVSHDGSVQHNFNDPAPLTVTYDYTYFQDTLILDTMIIDTAFVEFVDGSNCHLSADGFCDTAPDYIANRWNCNGNDQSFDIQTDPSGATFQSDGTLIMSYANDACSYRFSAEQIAAMRANLVNEKPELLYDQSAEEPVVGTAELLYPIQDELVQFNNVVLEWEQIPHATHYVLEISRLQNFPTTLTEAYLVDENSLVLTDLLNQKKYFWRVRAFNRQHFCAPFTEVESFETENLVIIDELSEVTRFDLYPTITEPGTFIRLQVETKESFQGNLNLFNLVGQKLAQENYHFAEGNNIFDFGISDALPVGIYQLTLNVNGKLFSRKVLLQH